MIAAVLHDVVEDTGITSGALRAEGFAEAVVGIVDAMTALATYPTRVNRRRARSRSCTRTMQGHRWPTRGFQSAG